MYCIFKCEKKRNLVDKIMYSFEVAGTSSDYSKTASASVELLLTSGKIMHEKSS